VEPVVQVMRLSSHQRESPVPQQSIQVRVVEPTASQNTLRQLHTFERTNPVTEIGAPRIEQPLTGASAYAESFYRNLKTHFPKNPTTKTTSTNPDMLREQLMNFLRQEIATNTWKNYARAMGEYERFLKAKELLPSNYTASLFIVDLFYDDLRRETLHLTGLYQYAKDISAACGQGRCQGWDAEGDFYLKKVKHILYNMGGAIPHSHAKPMTQEHAYRVLSIPGWTEEERMIVFVMWMCAGREVDILNLNCGDCDKEKEDQEDLVVLNWVPKEAEVGAGSGRTKNSHGRVLTCVINARENTSRIWKYVEKRKERKLPFTNLSGEKIIKLLQKLDPEYTGHSPKRGALNHLGRKKCGFDLIGRMARHYQPGRDLPKHTELYLEPHIYGLMGRTQDATRLL